MSANAIDNANLLNHRDDQGTTGFNPAVTFDYDASAKTVEAVDASEFPSGVALKKTIVRVHDKFGGEVRGTLSPGTGSGSGENAEATINVATLDASKGLDITATVIADDNKLVADGSVQNINASGSVSSWDKQKNA